MNGTQQFYRVYVSELASSSAQANWLAFWCSLATGFAGVAAHSSGVQDVVLDAQQGRRVNAGLFEEPMGFINGTVYGDLLYQIEETDSSDSAFWSYHTAIQCTNFLPGSLPPSTPPLPPAPPPLMMQFGWPPPSPPMLYSLSCVQLTVSGSQSNDQADVDGVYTYGGSYNGHPYYASGSFFIYVSNDKWRVGSPLGAGGPFWKGASSGSHEANGASNFKVR